MCCSLPRRWLHKHFLCFHSSCTTSFLVSFSYTLFSFFSAFRFILFSSLHLFLFSSLHYFSLFLFSSFPLFLFSSFSLCLFPLFLFLFLSLLLLSKHCHLTATYSSLSIETDLFQNENHRFRLDISPRKIQLQLSHVTKFQLQGKPSIKCIKNFFAEFKVFK